MFVAVFAAALATVACFGVMLAWFRLADHSVSLQALSDRADAHAERLRALETERRAAVRR